MDGKTCKHVFEVAPIVLARISMYKNQARVAQEKEKEASNREKVATEREMLTRAMEEKLRERIAKEKLHNYKFALAVSWVFFATVFVLFFFFFFWVCFLCFMVGWENLEQSY